MSPKACTEIRSSAAMDCKDSTQDWILEFGSSSNDKHWLVTSKATTRLLSGQI